MLSFGELLGVPSFYGPALVMVVIGLAALGVPLPATLTLISAGALAAQGDLSLGVLVCSATGAAVLGDHLGYAAGRWGRHRLIARLARQQSVAARLAQAEQLTRRWGSWIVFLSRWLLTPVGPLINLTSGLLRQRWSLFLMLDLLGELLWVCLYVGLGWFFGERAQALSVQVGQIAWLGLAWPAVVWLGAWLRGVRHPPAVTR